MKKLLLVAMVFISINTWAQKIRVGFTTGVSVSNFKAKVDGKNESADAKAGFTAGIVFDGSVGKHFSFQPALNFVQKGSKEKVTVMGYTSNIRININYLEMPLNFLYNSRGKTVNFFAGAGPSVAIALNGKYKYSDNSNSESGNIKFGSNDEALMKSIDLGANFIAGVSFNNGLLLSCNYNMGLNDLYPQHTDGAHLKSHYFGIKLCYLPNFGKRK